MEFKSRGYADLKDYNPSRPCLTFACAPTRIVYVYASHDNKEILTTPDEVP
jgi:hypothetical protein